jgi:methylglutamate dehydrogenase subunit D
VLELQLKRASPLGPFAQGRQLHPVTAAAPIIVRECEEYALCTILARTCEVFERFKGHFGLELPRKPGFVRQSSTDIVCVEPSQWLVRRDGGAARALERELVAALRETASIFDQTDGRALFRLAGSCARDALSKGVLLDLHPTVFGPGSAASTSIAYMSVTFWQVDNRPTYDIVVFRSFAESLWHWLVEASTEFGVEVQFAEI